MTFDPSNQRVVATDHPNLPFDVIDLTDWTIAPLRMPDVRVRDLQPFTQPQAERLWLVTQDHRLLSSDDGGATWVDIAPPPQVDGAAPQIAASEDMVAVSVSVSVLGPEGSGLWVSDDLGRTWRMLDVGGAEVQIAIPLKDGNLIIGAGRHTYLTTSTDWSGVRRIDKWPENITATGIAVRTERPWSGVGKRLEPQFEVLNDADEGWVPIDLPE